MTMKEKRQIRAKIRDEVKEKVSLPLFRIMEANNMLETLGPFTKKDYRKLLTISLKLHDWVKS